MARVAMGDVWDDSKAFVAREAALLFPLAFATLGVGALIFGFALPDPVPGTPIEAGLPTGPWLAVLVPVLLLMLLGALAIAALVLRPGGSVGESLMAGVRRLPGVVLAGLVVGAAMVAVMLAAGIVTTVLALTLGGGVVLASKLLTVVMLPPLLWLGLRLVVLIALIADEPPTLRVIDQLRRAFALTGRHAGAIAGVALVYLIGSTLVTLALNYALGSVLLLIGRALGAASLAETLTLVVATIAGTILQAVWAVFQAMLYRRLARR